MSAWKLHKETFNLSHIHTHIDRADWISPAAEGTIVVFNENSEESWLKGYFAKFSLCLGMPVEGFEEAI